MSLDHASKTHLEPSECLQHKAEIDSGEKVGWLQELS